MSLPAISFLSDSKNKNQMLVYGLFQAEKPEGKSTGYLVPEAASGKGKLPGSLSDLLKESEHFSGKKNEISVLRAFAFEGFSGVVLAGLGNRKKWTSDIARQWGATVFNTQKKERLSTLAVEGSVFSSAKESERNYFVQAFCEGYWMACYEFPEYKKVDNSAFHPKSLEITGLKGAVYEKAAEKARTLAEAIHFCRSLGDRPGNGLTPKLFVKYCEQMAKTRKGISVRVLGRKEMEKEKMGLFIGVAQGSVEEPQLLVLEYKGGKKSDKAVALVGKGITFDSGGISLKPADRMEEMKYDMMGAATVAGTIQAVHDLGLDINVTGYMGLAENLPGGKAQKPGDIQRSSSGKSVEIINTDAEGRLVLADVLEYAQKDEPQAILDFATLTGAVVVALGTVTSGIMGTHSGLIAAIKGAAEATDERVWELPLYEEYEEDLKSSYADLRNSGNREAGSSKAGTFLKFFIDTAKYPWVHFDIAGSAYHRKDRNYYQPKFAAGVMVRMLSHLLENWKTLK